MTHRSRRSARYLAPFAFALYFSAGPLASQSQSDPRDLSSLDLESLLNVKVTTASKFSEKLSGAPGVISVISQDELRRFGAITLREILERVPGFSGTSAYFTDRSLMAARGDQTKINSGHILYLINGRPTREILEGGVMSDLLESFPVAALERIEVIKGPGSVLYGSNAFSAVVNLITRKADRTEATLTASGGEKAARAGSGRIAYHRGAFSVVGAAQFHEKPYWRTTYRIPDALLTDPFSAGLPRVQNVTLRDRGPGAYLGVNYKNLSFMSSFTQWQAPTFVRGTVGENRWRRGFVDLGYNVKATDRWQMSFNSTYTRTGLRTYDYPNISRDAHELVLEWTNFLDLGKNDRATFGTLYSHMQGEEFFHGLGFPLNISGGARSGASVYGQLDHSLSDQVKLVGGFQVNKVETIHPSAVPRAGVIWNPSSRIAVKALYGRAFRAPSINETGLNHPALSGTPGLRPEKVGTMDIGITYQGNRVQYGVNYFWSKHTDSIVVDTRPQRWLYANLGKATFHGAELEGKYYFSKSFLLLGSMLYQHNRDGEGHQNVTPIANFGAKGGVSYTSDHGWALSAFDSFQGSLNGYSTTVNPPAKPYHLLSARWRYDFSRFARPESKTGVALFVHAENLANYQVWMPDWGENTNDTIAVHRGRTVYFGLELTLRRE